MIDWVKILDIVDGEANAVTRLIKAEDQEGAHDLIVAKMACAVIAIYGAAEGARERGDLTATLVETENRVRAMFEAVLAMVKRSQ